MQQVLDPALELVNDVAQYSLDPAGFICFAYPWSEGGLEAPRDWQLDAAEAIGRHLQDPETRFQPCEVAVSSGHGIGKSAFIAMMIQWAMSTCEDCKVVLTANTETQLRTKTWPEVIKWFTKGITAQWFKVGDTSITVLDKGHDKTWRADRVTWSENNTEAFAGLHNAGKRILLVFDEASSISDKVWETAEGALTDEDTEIIWLAFGNPTLNTGRFKECFGRLKHRWITRQIDARKVPGTNKKQIQKWEDDYGADSDFFRVRVRGEFPRAASNQLIASDLVEEARKYKATNYENLPKCMSADIARFGDDQTVIGIRQGRKFRILNKYRGLDNVQAATAIQGYIQSEQPDMTVIDGDGLGAGVIDTLKHWGEKKIHEFHGGASPKDPNEHFNKRAEVWCATRDWLKAGAEIPDDNELDADLTGPTYDLAGGKRQHGSIILESKDDMKKRGLSSPDCGDSLAMTFAVTLVEKKKAASTSAVRGELGWMG
jgi:hypothetical protein